VGNHSRSSRRRGNATSQSGFCVAGEFTEKWSGIAYASGGLGDKSTESISRMSVGGFEQKRSGFSPGTSTLFSFTET